MQDFPHYFQTAPPQQSTMTKTLHFNLEINSDHFKKDLIQFIKIEVI